MTNALKVGDMVRVKDGFYCGYPEGSSYNLPRTNGFIKHINLCTVVVVFNGDITSPPINPNCLVKVESVSDSMFETKTVRVLRDGCYGIFDISNVGDGYVRVEINQNHMNVEDLKEGIHLFQQLIEYLEDKE